MRISTVRRTPVTTSASVSSITVSASGPRRRPGPRAAEHVAAEERVEQIVEAELAGRERVSARAGRAVGAEHVVLAAPLRIAHRVVGGVDLLEPLGRPGSSGFASGWHSRASWR